jgi:putative transposase
MLAAMGYPRSHLVDPDTPGVYHCVSKCVRQAFLCGNDPLTGRSYGHRRQLLEDRLHLLANQFSVSIHAYAVMSNHVHLVIAADPQLPQSWSDEDVHVRWRRVMPVRRIRPVADDGQADTEEEPLPQASPQDIARWRERVGSLSWFMRMPLEPRIRARLVLVFVDDGRLR